MTPVDILLVAGPCGPHPGGDLARCVDALLPALRGDGRCVTLNLLIQGAEPLPAALVDRMTARDETPAGPAIRVTRTPTAIGRPAAFNWLLSATTAPLVALLTDDVLVPARWLAALVAALQAEPRALAAGTPTATIPAGLHRVLHPGDGVVLYHREAFTAAGPFDIRYTPGSLERLDHAVALVEAGHRLVMEGAVTCRIATRPVRDPARLEAEALSGQTKFFGKWGDDVLTRLERRLNGEVDAHAAA